MEPRCQQCGKPMNPIDYMVGVVCMGCCRKNHAKVVGRRLKVGKTMVKGG